MPWRNRMSTASKAPCRWTYSQRSFGRVSRAKLQKPQLALQALLSANSHRPGPPDEATRRSVSHTRERGGASAILGSTIALIGKCPLPEGYVEQHSSARAE